MSYLLSAVVLLVFVSLSSVRDVSSCSLTKAPKKYSMEYTLYNAEVVVIGTDIAHLADLDNNAAIFSVDCVMKSGGYNIERNITLLEAVFRSSCHGTDLEVGISYIMALEVAEMSKQTFRIYEPGILNPGEFEPSQENLRVASTVCGLTESLAVEGTGGPVEDVCPEVTILDSECVKGGALTVIASFWTVLSMFAFTFCQAL